MTRSESMSDEARRRGVSRQLVWAERKARAGLCMTCGQPRNLYRWRGDVHEMTTRAWQRQRYGYHPWRPGGKGRPPFWAPATP